MDTGIRLYKCFSCGKTIFKEQLEAGYSHCSCGENKVQYAPPTFWRVVKLFLKYPKYFKLYWKENISQWKIGLR